MVLLLAATAVLAVLHDPIPDSSAVVQAAGVRLTVLGSDLMRVQVRDDDAAWDDRPTL